MGEINMQQAEYVVIGVVVTTLIGGAFLLGFSAGYNWALLQVLPYVRILRKECWKLPLFLNQLHEAVPYVAGGR